MIFFPKWFRYDSHRTFVLAWKLMINQLLNNFHKSNFIWNSIIVTYALSNSHKVFFNIVKLRPYTVSQNVRNNHIRPYCGYCTLHNILNPLHSVRKASSGEERRRKNYFSNIPILFPFFMVIRLIYIEGILSWIKIYIIMEFLKGWNIWRNVSVNLQELKTLDNCSSFWVRAALEAPSSITPSLCWSVVTHPLMVIPRREGGWGLNTYKPLNHFPSITSITAKTQNICVPLSFITLSCVTN